MKTQEPTLVLVVMGAAGALAWLLGRRAPAVDPAAGRPVLQLPATGDGTTLASVAETREALDVLFSDEHCDGLPRKGQRRRCKRKLARKLNKQVKRAAKHVVNVDAAAMAWQGISAVGGLASQVGQTVSQVYGAQAPAATTPATVK